ncbi:hypothetical protein FA09DRAFT_288012, partial [Tilletiopsis washingtonensis]
DIGDMPYRIAKPVLESCRAEQLVVLEEASPHLLESTEELWRKLALADFATVRREEAAGVYERKPPRSWRKHYLV